MRRVFTNLLVGVLLCLFSISLLPAQTVPHLMNVQGKLTDSNGDAVADGSYMVTFSIYNVSSGGTALWSESITLTTSGGLFNAVLGETNPIPDSLFTDSSLWLGLQVESDPEMTPRQRLTTSPYAFRVANVTDSTIWVKNGNIVSLQTISDSVGIGTIVPEAKFHVVGDTSAGAIVGVSSVSTGTSTYTAGVSAINSSGGPGLYAESNNWHSILAISNNLSATIIGRNDGEGPGIKGQNQSTGPAITGYANTGNLLELYTTPGPNQKVIIDNSGNIVTEGMLQSNNGGVKFPDGTVQTTAATHPLTQAAFGFVTYKLPAGGVIAYGDINTDGSVLNATSNVTSTWNAAYKRYEITISGESYYYLNYTTIVTPISKPCVAIASSMSGKLVIYLYEVNTQ